MAITRDTKSKSSAGLLPAGLSDLMPEDASRESAAIASILLSFSALGYQRVKPPLVEFEDTLLADGPGAALAGNSFRVMDPQSGQMMAIRADMTAQIARIASSRLKHQPRPLRLAYSGDVLRVQPDPLNPERQLTQVGAEMIGAHQISHDAELAVAALAALQDAGVDRLTIDLGAPRLLGAITDAGEDLRQAVSAKDQMLVQRHGGDAAELLQTLLDMPMVSADKIDEKVAQCAQKMPPEAAAMLTELSAMATLVREAMPDVMVTVDPLESRGFDYHHGVGFAIFSPGIRGELGRGGRYRTRLDDAMGEDSTGVTLYLERILRALKPAMVTAPLYIPYDAGLAVLVAMMRQGEACRFGSADTQDPMAEAKAMGCSQILLNGQKAPVQ